MFRQLTIAPPALTRNETIGAGVAALVVAITRIYGRACSPWDWDEVLFALGVRNFDVARHHPHPPGYPLFIALAKAARLIAPSDFAALQMVVLAGAVLLFPALFLLARELRFDYATSLFGSLLVVFLPNVWFYGETAFSDVPGLTAGIFGCALLLRGCRDARAYVAGALIAGLSAGIRPQNLWMAIVPFLIATICRIRVSWKPVIAGAAAGAIAIGGCYAGAALASSSVDGYVGAVRAQQQWLHDVDSFHNPQRTPLTRLWRMCVLWPAGPRRFLRIVDLFAAVSLLHAAWRRRLSPLITLSVFLPSIVFTWLMLSIDAMPRYTVGYVALHGLLAADGIAVVSRRAIVQGVLSLTLIALLAIWTWPAVSAVHRIPSPPEAAFRYVMQRAKPHQTTIWVHRAFGPQSDYGLADYNRIFFEQESEITGPGFVITPILDPTSRGVIFTMPRYHLWDIARRRNFEVQVRER